MHYMQEYAYSFSEYDIKFHYEIKKSMFKTGLMSYPIICDKPRIMFLYSRVRFAVQRSVKSNCKVVTFT